MKKWYLLLLLLSLSIAWAQYDQSLNRFRKRFAVYAAEKQDVMQLQNAAIDIDYCSFFDGIKVYVYATPEEVNLIEHMKYRIEPAPVVIGKDSATVKYHTHNTVTEELKNLEKKYPNIARLQSIGKSVQGRDLWMMKISDNVQKDEPEPEVKYVSTMHGDEPVGQEMLIYLIEVLLKQYGKDKEITALVDNLEIWIMPNMNPDGTALQRRYNADWVDLNRNFPDPQDDPNNTPAGRAIETRLMMNFTAKHHFCISINFHTGALVVNYPWDTMAGDPADIDLIKHLSLGYAIRNKPMYKSSHFKNGITNGYDWYEVNGGMQDWNYHWYSDIELTLELSDRKWPDADKLPGLWEDNRESLLWYIAQARTGLNGNITDAGSKKPVAATMTVTSIGKSVVADENGNYQRVLLPGVYTLKFSAPGYQDLICKNVKVQDGKSARLDVELRPIAAWQVK